MVLAAQVDDDPEDLVTSGGLADAADQPVDGGATAAAAGPIAAGGLADPEDPSGNTATGVSAADPNSAATAVNVDDSLGFVDLPGQTILEGGGLDSGDATQDSSNDPSGPATGGGLTGLDGVDDSNLDDTLTGTGGLVDPGDSSQTSTVADDNQIITIDPDPGVNIDPQQNPQQVLLAGILKVLLDAIFSSSNASQPLGAIGAAIAEVLEKYEQQAMSGIRGTADLNAVPADGILSVILQHLNVRMSAGDQAAAIAAWRGAMAGRSGTDGFDQNRNGQVADDIAVWFIVWLLQQGQFNPASHVTITQDASGNPIGVLTSGPSTDWLNGAKPPIVLGNNAIETEEAEITKPLPPLGKSPVALGHGPDWVCVPDVVESTVGESHEKLEAISLHVSEVSSLFASDSVLASDPAKGTWVEAGSDVRLDVRRRVPNVVKLTRDRAEELLNRWKLRAGWAGKRFSDDVVVSQKPEAGSLARPNERIALDLWVAVPKVHGLAMEKGSEALQKRDLKWTAATRAFKTDLIVAQGTAPGTLVEHGSDIQLTLNVRVPSVVGRSLADARQTLAQWDLDATEPNTNALAGDVVRGQEPAEGTFVEHQSSVTLDPIVGVVPDVRRMSVAEAARRLRDDENYQVRTVGDGLDTDEVTMQTPSPGSELERGKTVVIDVRVRVPNLLGDPIEEARQIVRTLGGDLRDQVTDRYARTDVVYRQDPEPDTLVPPRTTISLTPGVRIPDLRGMTPDEADEALRRVAVNGRVVSSGTRPTPDRSLVGRRVIDGQRPGPGVYDRRAVGDVEVMVTQFILDTVTVPIVTEERVSVAIAQIKAAGLTPIIQFGNNTYNELQWAIYALAESIRIEGGFNPFVETQDPQGGQEVPRGSQVRIAPEVAR